MEELELICYDRSINVANVFGHLGVYWDSYWGAYILDKNANRKDIVALARTMDIEIEIKEFLKYV